MRGCYHKVNLTAYGEIPAGLTSGAGPVVVETDIRRLGGIVCFDLNFEEIRRQYRALRPDILCFARMYHGGRELPDDCFERSVRANAANRAGHRKG